MQSGEQTVAIKYKECMKNHAIAVGGNETDGCGEFLPDGEEGTIEAPSCSACHCHRNFHRKEVAADKEFLVRNALEYQAGTLVPSRSTLARVPNRMGGAAGPSLSGERGGGVAVAGPSQVVKKRFRTKFTQEQKEKMQDFAEKVGWKIQKLDESVVQRFCQEVGVKRRVLRVWMHNNKRNFAKKNVNQPNVQN